MLASPNVPEHRDFTMGQFLHTDAHLDAGDTVVVTLDRQANVILLDPINFDHYRRGQTFHYYGGRALRSPMRIRVPHTDHWHVVVDLGGAGGHIRHSVTFLRTGALRSLARV